MKTRTRGDVDSTTTRRLQLLQPFLPSAILYLILEQVYCLYLLFTRAIPFVADLWHQFLFATPNEHLPSSIDELLDASVYNRVILQGKGPPVKSVRYSNDQPEQHANSTDRAWLTVTTITPSSSSSVPSVDRKEQAVFVKIQARTFLVRCLMCIFDVYRNELDAYASPHIFSPLRDFIPRVYCARWTPSRFVLVLEDLRQKGVSFPAIWKTTVTKTMAQKVLVTLAGLHAKFWNNCPPWVLG